MLTANGGRETSRWPYAYAAFSDGTPIPACFRSYFQKNLAGKLAGKSDAFGAADDPATLLHVFQSPLLGGPLTVAAMAVYHSSPDLQAAFPQVPGKDCACATAQWFTRREGARRESSRHLLIRCGANWPRRRPRPVWRRWRRFPCRCSGAVAAPSPAGPRSCSPWPGGNASSPGPSRRSCAGRSRTSWRRWPKPACSRDRRRSPSKCP